MPGYCLLFVEGINGLSCNSDREQLGGKGMCFPPVMTEESQLERLEQRQHASNIQAIQRRLEFCDLLNDGMGTVHTNFVDFGVMLPGNVESALLLLGEDRADGGGIDANEIVQLYVDELVIALSLHC
jgi:hypothetical protein